MQPHKKFAFDVGITFFASVVTLPLSFVITIALGRYLGAGDLGLYQMTSTIYWIAMLGATLGIPSAMIKYVAEFKEDKNKFNQIVSSGVITSLFLGIAFAALFYFSSGIFAGIFNMPGLSGLLKILSLIFPFAAVSVALLGLLNGLRGMKKYATATIIHGILMVIVTVSLIYYGFGVSGAVIGFVLSQIGTCLFLIWVSKDYFEFMFGEYVTTLKKMTRFGVQALGVNSLSTIEMKTDIILIGYLLTATDVGYYSVAISIAGLLLLVPQAIQRITYPATSEYWAKNNHSALNKMIDKSMKYSACILLPLALVFLFFGKEIVVLLFRQEFVYSILPLQILLIGRVIRGSTLIPIGASLTGAGRPDLSLKIRAISVATNVGLNVLLIPIFGIVGAAIATATSAILGTMLFLALIIKTLTVKIDFRWYIRAMGMAFIALVFFFGAASLTNPYLAGGAILLIYVAIIFKFLLTAEDKAMFWSLLRYPIH